MKVLKNLGKDTQLNRLSAKPFKSVGYINFMVAGDENNGNERTLLLQSGLTLLIDILKKRNAAQ